MQISNVTGFIHFSTRGWHPLSTMRGVETFKNDFVSLCLCGVCEPYEISAYAQNWEESDKKVPAHTFLGMAKYEWEAYQACSTNKAVIKLAETIVNRRRPEGRITAFFVRMPDENLAVSFSFCSPDDVKLGLFNKSDGRMIALRRFYGIDKEELRRVIIASENGESPYDVILGFLKDLAGGAHSKENGEDIRGDGVPHVVIPKHTEHAGFSWVHEVKGEVKIPNWLFAKISEHKYIFRQRCSRA